MRITWDAIEDRIFKNGLDHGVFYKRVDGLYPLGVPWNGLHDVDDSTSGRDVSALYSGDVRRDMTKTKPERSGTINCYTYPEAMDECLGAVSVTPDGAICVYDQDEPSFGFTYRRRVCDVTGEPIGYEIHIIYNASITGFKDHIETVGSDVDTEALGFEFTSIPEPFTGYDPVSHLVIRTDRLSDARQTALEKILYGSQQSDPYLPLPDALYDVLYGEGLTSLSSAIILSDVETPDTITVNLYANDEIIETRVINVPVHQMTFEFDSLPTETDDGEPIEYLVSANDVPRYEQITGDNVLYFEKEQYEDVNETYFGEGNQNG